MDDITLKGKSDFDSSTLLQDFTVPRHRHSSFHNHRPKGLYFTEALLFGGGGGIKYKFL